MPLRDPRARAAYAKRHRAEKPESARKAARAWVARNPDAAKASNDRWRLSPEGQRKILERKLHTRYGITVEQRDAMLAAQSDRCACCDSAEPGARGWQVDHDHDTKAIRGICCGKCNRGLGLLGDNLVGVERAASYLRRNTIDNLTEATVEEHV